jgi:hypothetical protein
MVAMAAALVRPKSRALSRTSMPSMPSRKSGPSPISGKTMDAVLRRSSLSETVRVE